MGERPPDPRGAPFARDGYSGFQEFKLRLAQSLALARSATHSVIPDRDGLSAVTDKIFEYALTSPDRGRRHLGRAALQRAVDILAGARSIAFFGYGASAIVAMDASRSFRSSTVPAVPRSTRISRSWRPQ